MEEQKYFAAIGRSFFDLELSKEHLPFRILDVCTCSKSDQLFFQYYALALSSAFKWSEFDDISNCHFTPCKEVCETPDFQFIPDQSNHKEVKKTAFFPFFHLFFTFFLFSCLYIPFFQSEQCIDVNVPKQVKAKAKTKGTFYYEPILSKDDQNCDVDSSSRKTRKIINYKI